jgi:hypothetical protein
MKQPREGDLRVYWFPGGHRSINFPVHSVQEGITVLVSLRKYDTYLINEGIRDDHSRLTGGLEVFDGTYWDDWRDEGRFFADDYVKDQEADQE